MPLFLPSALEIIAEEGKLNKGNPHLKVNIYNCPHAGSAP